MPTPFPPGSFRSQGWDNFHIQVGIGSTGFVLEPYSEESFLLY